MLGLFRREREDEPSIFENASRYPEEGGNVVIYLPDGHLFDRGENSAGKDIWSYTGMPYSTLGETEGYQTRGNNLLFIPREKLRSLGYEDPEVERALLVTRRPHNIPESVLERGAGISGKDLYADRLAIELANGDLDSKEYYQELEKRGIFIPDEESLGFRPASIVWMSQEEITSMDELIDQIERYNHTVGKPIRIATEFPFLTSYCLVNNGIAADSIHKKQNGVNYPRGTSVLLLPTNGKTEAYVYAGDAELATDVAESGDSIIKAELTSFRPELMKKTVPFWSINSESYERFEDFFDELTGRLYEGRDSVRRKHPEWFEQDLDQDIFLPASERQEKALIEVAK